MSNEQTQAVDRQERLNEILLGYVEAVQAGTPPDRELFLARHAELAADIVEFFASYDQVNRLSSPWREASERQALSRGPAADDAAKSGETTAVPGLMSPPERAELGQLGDFRLLREIGRGGMGVVYEAEQISLHRRVALKVLPFAAGADQRQLQRFRNEAEAAAHLHHSNIVPVFAVGSERGVHYYAMQYIEGQSLANLIASLTREAQSRSGADEPGGTEVRPANAVERSTNPVALISTEHSARTRRFFRMAAGIGKQAALALEYAHQMGVIHRDIKPANLLLDSRGDVWIADFGLAQFRSQAGVTMTGELLGTLRYVSPEQTLAKRGLVDHRTDIYSLGATLYQMLTLEPVFDGQDRHELLHQISFAEPRPLRTINPSIPVELETIVLKALAKNPGERYGTAQELADDLARFLEDKPIQAKRPTALERARKWLRRRPSFVAAAVLLLVCGVVGFAISTALVGRAYERERQRASEAEERFQLARRSADDMIRIAEEELADNPSLHNLRRRLLEAALIYYQEFIDQRRADPEAQAELATTRDRVKTILGDLAVLQGAWQLFLLKNPPVLDDLGLTPEQRGRVAQLVDKQRPDLFREFRSLGSEERQKRFVELAYANENDLAAILNRGQLGRLRQIALQCQGPAAFLDVDVASALTLTPEQQKQIRNVAFSAFRDCPDPGGPRGGKKPPPKPFEETREGALAQIKTVLTAAQEKAWHELIGKPFADARNISLPPPPRQPGFGPPPPRSKDNGDFHGKRPKKKQGD